MAKRPTMNEVYPDGFTGDGIFADLQDLDVPWKDASVNEYLDIIYYTHSGDKRVSSIVEGRLSEGVLSSAARDILANSLFVLYGVKWEKLYNTLSFEYNPIENYRMVEEESTTITDSGTIDRDGSNSRTDSGTIDNDGTQSDIIDKTYGFNSSSAVNADTSTNTVDSTITHDLTFGETIDETETHDLTLQNDRELTRSGNIGVTTSQQMITSERELWNWNFFNTVFEDIDSIICLDIYDLGE